MSGYRGDGYGAHGDHGDETFRFGEGDDKRGRRGPEPDGDRSFWNREPRQGAGRGNLMGHSEERVREWLGREDGMRPGGERLADDPRAVAAADDWRRQHGREGYEGSYARHDEPYGSYRQRHLDELDRDYHAWCREQEQQFGRDFGSWRQQRAGRTTDGSVEFGSEE
ncbi:MAG: hypothetical protein AVDCRST_MAG09-947 [uncultured Sphingomonas sp.]|uniref:Uncharacterized protein n=1 Tax=uncultured Sphingomonas sp. TaxID=158754 RepID=A0A6J4SIT6_9SPHN|nr:hypothetical protein [uncultured Sphingomonas sp.]CAA9500158.1 MAG: hypothetical protein AVDCRST_MAG09-947 [uncultured Sphingomonas sp.]